MQAGDVQTLACDEETTQCSEGQHLVPSCANPAYSLSQDDSRPERVAGVVEDPVLAFVAIDLDRILRAARVGEAESK